MIGASEVPEAYMKYLQINFSVWTVMAIACCQCQKATPVVKVKQQNILPAGEVVIQNLTSNVLEIEMGGVRYLLNQKNSKKYSGLKSEVEFLVWIVDGDSREKVAWFNEHPNIVGTEVIISDHK